MCVARAREGGAPHVACTGVRLCAAVVVLAAGLAPAVSPSLAQPAPLPSTVTAAECDAVANFLTRIVQQWTQQGGRHADFDSTGFWNKVKTPIPTDLWYGKGMLASHLAAEEGLAYPLRSGFEVAFYERLKARIASASPTARLTLSDLLTMGLDTCADSAGHANVSLTFLTLHNVMRVLARPRAWFDDVWLGGWRADDPMLPVLRDLAGSGAGSLPDLVKNRFNVKLDRNGAVENDFDTSDNGNRYWSMRMFGADGAFEGLRGTPDMASNGGAHYYVWVGALGQSEIGGAWLGAWAEWLLKSHAGDRARGNRQIGHFNCGAELADEMYAQRGLLGNAGALSLAALDYPGALAMGQSGDLRAFWFGSATLPVTLELQPAPACPADCVPLTVSSTSRDQPLDAPGFLRCGWGVQPVSYAFQAVLSDAANQRSATYPVTYTCVPATRGGVVNVSGDLDRVIVQQKIDHWNGLGWTLTFPGSFASFQLLEDGTATVSPVIVFKSDIFKRGDPALTYDHITRFFYTEPGRGDVNAAGGRLWQCLDRVWFWGWAKHAFCHETMAEGSWGVRRQADGSYLLTIANGEPAGYADIPYRLR